MPVKKNYTWEELEFFIKKLGKIIQVTTFIPDIILGITRGGCFPALLLSHILEVRTFYTLSISTTIDETIRAKRIFHKVHHSFDSEIIANKKILIVDDVVNTGKTLEIAYNSIIELNPKEIKTACIFWDTILEEFNKNNQPDFCYTDYYSDKVDAWIIFPWEIN